MYRKIIWKEREVRVKIDNDYYIETDIKSKIRKKREKDKWFMIGEIDIWNFCKNKVKKKRNTKKKKEREKNEKNMKLKKKKD